MTAVVEGTKAEAERLARELDRLVSVIRVEAMTSQPAVSRDLALIKVAVDAETRPEVMHICEVFRARIVDVARKSVIVELTGTESKIEGFADLLRPLGIIEMVRTGLVSMARADHVLEHDSNVSSWVEHRRRIQADRLLQEAV
jgi:acetolactate synthase-1/3 small subunit